MQKKALTLVGIILLLSIGGYLAYKQVNTDGRLVSLDRNGTAMIDKVSKQKEDETKAYEWIASISKEEDAGYLPTSEESDISSIFNKPSNLIVYLFATANEKDQNAVLSLFHPETTIEDFHLMEGNDPVKGLDDLIGRLLRHQKVEDVGVTYEKRDAKKADVQIKIIYEDGKKIPVDVEMELLSSSHDEDVSIFFITSTLHDIVGQIEKRT